MVQSLRMRSRMRGSHPRQPSGPQNLCRCRAYTTRTQAPTARPSAQLRRQPGRPNPSETRCRRLPRRWSSSGRERVRPWRRGPQTWIRWESWLVLSAGARLASPKPNILCALFGERKDKRPITARHPSLGYGKCGRFHSSKPAARAPAPVRWRNGQRTARARS